MKKAIKLILTILSIFLIYSAGMLSYGRTPLYIWIILMLPSIMWLIYISLEQKANK